MSSFFLVTGRRFYLHLSPIRLFICFASWLAACIGGSHFGCCLQMLKCELTLPLFWFFVLSLMNTIWFNSPCFYLKKPSVSMSIRLKALVHVPQGYLILPKGWDIVFYMCSVTKNCGTLFFTQIEMTPLKHSFQMTPSKHSNWNDSFETLKLKWLLQNTKIEMTPSKH